MRALGVATVVLTLVTGLGAGAGVAVADGHGMPSHRDVERAKAAVRHKAADVATVRARLAVANQRLHQSAVVAEQAAEAFNGARWRAQQARREAAAAQRRADAAEADVQRQRRAVGDAIVRSYELAPGLTALSALVRSDGIDSVISSSVALQNAEDALNDQYGAFRASSTIANVAARQAREAARAASRAEEQARAAREAARAAADRAAAQAHAIAEEKARLVRQLAHLQHISVRLAQRRQAALERRAAAAAARAAEHEAEVRAAQEQAREQAQREAQEQSSSAGPSVSSAPLVTSAPPATASGVGAAIGFARAQLGKPYVWGAAGPDAWDCSGLTMGAWRAGGISLPHYSVAQYEASTPISYSELQPGDLVFWGSTSDPSSIYHVALYVGDGMIIQAPHTGASVDEVSIYSWTLPNFYARP